MGSPFKILKQSAWVIGSLLVLLVAIIAYGQLLSQPLGGAPVAVVSMTRSNGPLKVFPGVGGCLFILPDGSLWRWRGLGPLNLDELTDQPVRIGTSSDWFSAAPGWAPCLAVKTNGTLWEWARNLGADPAQIGAESNWVSAAVDDRHIYALRGDGTLWRGGGPGPHRNPFQVNQPAPGGQGAGSLPGTTKLSPVSSFSAATSLWDSKPAHATSASLLASESNLIPSADHPVRLPRPPGNGSYLGRLDRDVETPLGLARFGSVSDWKSIGSLGQGFTMGVRSNGTLWVWGQIPFYQIPGDGENFRLPVQVCRETNWAGLEPGLSLLARNSSGELWLPFLSTPNSAAPVSQVCQRVGLASGTNRLALAFVGRPVLFRLEGNGVLQMAEFRGGRSSPVVSTWRPFGPRTDWVSLWSIDGNTALGLTADGTLWRWGADPLLPFKPDPWLKWRQLRNRLLILFGRPPVPLRYQGSITYSETPRPVLRMNLLQ